MLSAFATSALFLTSYLIYHANVGSRPFPGQGPIRIIYLTILLTHIVLAAAILPMALITLNHALRSTVHTSRPHRPLDAADLALRLGHGRHRVFDAVSDSLVARKYLKIHCLAYCSIRFEARKGQMGTGRGIRRCDGITRCSMTPVRTTPPVGEPSGPRAGSHRGSPLPRR